MKWKAHVDFSFLCPQCGQWILDANPSKCPHRIGRRAHFSPARDGPLENEGDIRQRLGMTATAPQAKVFTSVEDEVAQSCSHGT